MPTPTASPAPRPLPTPRGSKTRPLEDRRWLPPAPSQRTPDPPSTETAVLGADQRYHRVSTLPSAPATVEFRIAPSCPMTTTTPYHSVGTWRECSVLAACPECLRTNAHEQHNHPRHEDAMIVLAGGVTCTPQAAPPIPTRRCPRPKQGAVPLGGHKPPRQSRSCTTASPRTRYAGISIALDCSVLTPGQSPLACR